MLNEEMYPRQPVINAKQKHHSITKLQAEKKTKAAKKNMTIAKSVNNVICLAEI